MISFVRSFVWSVVRCVYRCEKNDKIEKGEKEQYMLLCYGSQSVSYVSLNVKDFKLKRTICISFSFSIAKCITKSSEWITTTIANPIQCVHVCMLLWSRVCFRQQACTSIHTDRLAYTRSHGHVDVHVYVFTLILNTLTAHLEWEYKIVLRLLEHGLFSTIH